LCGSKFFSAELWGGGLGPLGPFGYAYDRPTARDAIKDLRLKDKDKD